METFEKCVRRHREASVRDHIPRHRHSDNCKPRLPLISRQVCICVEKINSLIEYKYPDLSFDFECSILFSHESLLCPLV